MEITEKKQTSKKDKKIDSDWNIRPYLAIGLIAFIVICSCILVVCVLFRFSAIKESFGVFLNILQPILIGLAIGYLMNPVMMFIERGLHKVIYRNGMKKKFNRIIRTISSILAVLIFILVIVMLISMVIPEVSANVSHLVDTMPAQINSFIVNMNAWEFGSHEITDRKSVV